MTVYKNWERQNAAMVKIVCKICHGWSRIEYTAYPSGPLVPVFCPFCAADNTPQRSESEQAILRASFQP